MKKIKFILAAATIFVAQGLFAQLTPVVTEKTATGPNDDGTYTLTLKSYVTGEVIPHEAMAPADIIFAMDLSGSMKNNIGKDNVYNEVNKPMSTTLKAIKETTKAITTTTNDKATATTKNATVVTKKISATEHKWNKTQNWTYKNISTGNAEGTANYSKYYRDDNGDYYVVHRANNLVNSTDGKLNVRALWYVDKSGNTWYFTSTGLSATYEDITSDTGTIWNGTFYTGWTYKKHTHTSGESTVTDCYGFDYGNADATDKDQWYYLHTDGEYYPVRRAANLPDSNGGNTARAAWIVIDGVTWYLRGEKLDTDYDHDMMTDYRSIYFGSLYKGGWTYAGILAATAENGHYYKHTDGKYYAVQKAQETVNGVNTYQAFVELPEGKRYLYGTNKISAEPCPFSTATNISFYFGELNTGGWSYKIVGTDGTAGTKYYYLHTDGEYYPVRRETSTNNFQLYVEVPEGRRYFNGNDLSETPYALSTTQHVVVYFGSFYTMTGWSYAGVTAATVGGGHYYKHTNDEYYPVLKEDLGATQTANRYQLYVEVPEGKRYLWGHDLHAEVCPYSAATATVIWYGSLYKGGWAYNSITVNTSDKQGYSYLHSDGEYYPIFQETVTIDGATTYQDYVILPDGNKWYFCGSEISRNPYPYAVKNTVNNWFGPLYSGAWTYANLTAGNAASGFFYLHSDGEYYAVLKEDNGASAGSSRYQLYVEVPEGKRYLYGNGLSEDPYPFSARNNVAIYYQELYSGGWTYSGITAGSASGGHYYKYGVDGEGNDMYYPVQKEDLTASAGNARYQAFVELPVLGKMYLHGSTISSEPYPTSAATGASLYFGPLYKLTLNDYTRYEGLRRAVSAFVDKLAANCASDNVHSRVALVQYANASWAYKPGNQTSKDLPHLKQFTNAAAAGNSAVLCDFQDLLNPAGVQALHDALPEGAPTTGATRPAYGMVLAKGLFQREAGNESDYDGNGATDDYETRLFSGDPYAPVGGVTRKKILITIGDGEDNQTGEWKTWADNFKTNVPDAKVFVVHVQTTPIKDHEKYVASQDETREDGSVFHYYYDVKYYDETLIEALLGISSEIGGAKIELGSTSVVQDVVTPEFSIPTGARIQMFTANCIGGDATHLEFEDESSWDSFSGSYTRTDNTDGTTTILVTGFNFSANWCGYHGADEGYKGQQLIIQFPILPKGEIVGGEIDTNTPDSQILDDDGDPVQKYPIPVVGPFPMHLQIVKNGLLEGESAVFNIWRKAPDAADYDKTGAPFMKVVLTGVGADTPVEANIQDLDWNYDYLIEESGWSWQYTAVTGSISTTEQTMNPFIFDNTRKTNITTKSAEDNVKNEFF